MIGVRNFIKNGKHFGIGLFVFVLCILTTYGQVNHARKAPAYPLITHNPNFSIWSTSDLLTDKVTEHWTGAAHGLTGYLEVDGTLYRFMGKEKHRYTSIIAADDKATIRYVEQPQNEAWQLLDFEDSDWKDGVLPISDDKSVAGTFWSSDNIWVRREFSLDNINDNEPLFLKLHHDDNIEVYLNGTLVFKRDGWNHRFDYFDISSKAKGLLRKGQNVLAIHLKNTAGGRFLDFDLVNSMPSDKAKVAIAKQTSVAIEATQTAYTFDAGAVALKVTFTSPLLMDDLDLLARPVSYISYEVTAKDGKEHDVKIHQEVSSDIAVYMPDQQEVEGQAYQDGKLSILKVGTVEQPVLQKGADDMRIDWGYLYVAVPRGNDVRQFLSGSNDPKNENSYQGKSLVLHTEISLDAVGSAPVQRFLTIGYDEIYAIQYFHTDLRPWWNRNGDRSFESQLHAAVKEYKKLMQRCTDFDSTLRRQAEQAGGEKYAHLSVLAYRQSIAAHTLVESPKKEVLWLSKENNSGGFINTVDVTYPSSPLYLIYNPVLLEGMLNGIFYFSESGKYPHPWAAHDLGTYPLANGQQYGEPMPVEESGNMLIMTAAIAHAQGNAAYAEKHWTVLTKWADYLIKEGLDPKTQLCTDDFAGHLARNANLSVKAIMGIASYARLADMLGLKDVALKYQTIAEEMVPQWMKLADAGDHYALTFDDPNTWSQKYNLIWDKVLDFGLFPKEVIEKELTYYIPRVNRYGLPLDSRKNYTKNDWILWTATLADDQPTFEKFIEPVFRHAIETPSRVPLNDFYDTTDGIRENFKARSVVGGFYMKLLAEKWGR
ncbi:glutaminase family protein [Sphingobacterium gobiense]|uniref:Glutaminase n=1 Tax=Sphingobacterium gobiense TaxID=1382456 RepID=A0A2S9JLI3_9SPHI|nr:glutaminase family protein [Sphingobacterium gobiense]PRD54002.1 glutaminase [Sphingobacterium gobiense]